MCRESLSSKTSLVLLALTLAVLLQTQNDLVLVSADLTYAGSHCAGTAGNYSDGGGAFQVNLGQVVANLTQDASGNAFFSNASAGNGADQVFGLYYCNGAMDAADCSACVEAAAGEIQDSCATKEAIVWYLECTLRYANLDIFSQAELSPYAHLSLDQHVSNRTALSRVLATAVPGLIKAAAAANATGKPKPPAYAAARANLSSTESLVAVAQCTPDIAGPACTKCLEAAAARMASCCSDTVGAMVFLPSCQLLYTSTSNSSAPAPSSHSNPFSSTTKPSSGNGGYGRGIAILAVVTAAFGFLIFTSLNIT